MALLAEPRKRRKNPMHSVNLSAPNHWTNDDSKFGQRMLEKFGWSKGNGLGKNEQGISEIIRVQHKVTPTGLGFIANNADDWFKAGEEYSRLLSQLTEKFDQYQALPDSNENDSINSKKSLEKNSLNSKSRVHYHKFTKGKDLTQYKKEELACILGKGLKDDDSSSKGLDMNTYFKTKRENKKNMVDKNDLMDDEDSVVVNDDQADEIMTLKEDLETNIDDDEQKINIIPKKKKKQESKQSKLNEIVASPLNVDLKRKKKKSKTLTNEVHIIDDVEKANNEITEEASIKTNKEEPKKKKPKKVNKEIVEDVKLSKKKVKLFCEDVLNNSEQTLNKKSKSLANEDSADSSNRECNGCVKEMPLEQEPKELVLTDKYQNLIDLIIENSSAGKKYAKLPSSEFEKKIEEFSKTTKPKLLATTSALQPKSTTIEEPPYELKTLNPDDTDFIKNFETQKSKLLESISNRQETAKYVDDKSMFIAKHGNVLFFGSNINDIKGYGEV